MAGKYRDGKSWYISWVDPDTKKQRRRSLGPVTEAEAETERNAKELRLVEPTLFGSQTFADWAIQYAKWHSEEYPDSYDRVESILRVHLLPAFGALPLLAIEEPLVNAYKTRRLASGATPGTVIKELRTLQAALNRGHWFSSVPY